MLRPGVVALDLVRTMLTNASCHRSCSLLCVALRCSEELAYPFDYPGLNSAWMQMRDVRWRTVVEETVLMCRASLEAGAMLSKLVSSMM